MSRDRSHSTNSYFGPVRNRSSPSGEPLSAGGSSGGSAVAVATGQRELYVLRTLGNHHSHTSPEHLVQIPEDLSDSLRLTQVLLVSSRLMGCCLGGA